MVKKGVEVEPAFVGPSFVKQSASSVELKLWRSFAGEDGADGKDDPVDVKPGSSRWTTHIRMSADPSRVFLDNSWRAASLRCVRVNLNLNAAADLEKPRPRMHCARQRGDQAAWPQLRDTVPVFRITTENFMTQTHLAGGWGGCRDCGRAIAGMYLENRACQATCIIRFPYQWEAQVILPRFHIPELQNSLQLSCWPSANGKETIGIPSRISIPIQTYHTFVLLYSYLVLHCYCQGSHSILESLPTQQIQEFHHAMERPRDLAWRCHSYGLSHLR